jgi:hypothetical protein
MRNGGGSRHPRFLFRGISPNNAAAAKTCAAAFRLQNQFLQPTIKIGE